MSDLVLYADGLCEPNPGGRLCVGWEARAGDVVIATGQHCVPPAPGHTNNQAEYRAVLTALAWAWRAGYRAATVRSDSQLVVNQVLGRWSCGAPALVPLLARLRAAQRAFTRLTFEWVPREENTRADALSRAAYRAATGRNPPEYHRRRAA